MFDVPSQLERKSLKATLVPGDLGILTIDMLTRLSLTRFSLKAGMKKQLKQRRRYSTLGICGKGLPLIRTD